MGLTEMIEKTVEEVAEEICDHYCKYPEQWDPEVEGTELIDSDVCRNCPLNRL